MRRTHVLDKLENILRQRRGELRKSLAWDFNVFSSRERAVGDSADAALDDDSGTVNSNLAEEESRELTEMDHALERIRHGTYGNCEGCGNEIAVARLQALPYATRCIECQRRSERRRRMEFGRIDWRGVVDSDEDASVHIRRAVATF